MGNYIYTIWCREDDDSVFSVSHCLSANEADTTCGMFAGMIPDCSFFITKEKDQE